MFYRLIRVGRNRFFHKKISESNFSPPLENICSYFSVSSVQSLSRVQLCDPMDCSTPSLPVHHQLLESTQTHVHWVSDVVPFSSHLQSFPASGSFPMSRFFASGSQSIGVSALTSVLPMNTQDWSPLGWTGWSPCSPRDSQESSPTPQFKSINSLVLSLLYSPTLASIHDYWKKT